MLNLRQIGCIRTKYDVHTEIDRQRDKEREKHAKQNLFVTEPFYSHELTHADINYGFEIEQ